MPANPTVYSRRGTPPAPPNYIDYSLEILPWPLADGTSAWAITAKLIGRCAQIGSLVYRRNDCIPEIETLIADAYPGRTPRAVHVTYPVESAPATDGREG